MGKWTAGYHDDVLGAKMKSLVAGALKRSKIAKESTISYENFVEGLDSGDSFTTSLIETLVMEVADRRKRPNADDRRLLSEKTARDLRRLTIPMRVFRDRTTARALPGRRSMNLSDYLTSPPEGMDMEEEEEVYERVEPEDSSSFVEGARINSDWFDVYGPSWSAAPMVSRRSTYPNPPSNEADGVPFDPPASSARPVRTSAWGTHAASPYYPPNSTSRIRRPVRTSRTIDFNEFSSQRRSAYRNSIDSEDLRSSEDIPNTLSPWVAAPVASDESLGSSGARRFFPFSRRRHESAPSPVPLEWEESPYSAPEAVMYHGAPPLVQAHNWGGIEAAGGDTPGRPQFPRPLRRGGIRAPESMLSRHASPVAGDAGDAGDDAPPSIIISVTREAHREVADGGNDRPVTEDQNNAQDSTADS